MGAYILTFCISLLFTHFAYKCTDNKFLRYLCSAIAVTLPALLAGYRDEVIGTDTANYVFYFEQAVTYNSFGDYYNDFIFIEPGFLMLNYIVSLLGGSTITYLFLVHLLIVATIYISAFLWRRYMDPTWVMFIFYFIMFNESLNAVRQYAAIAMVLLAFSLYAVKQKKLLAFIVAPLALMFHYSAIVCVILIFAIYWVKHNSLKESFFKLGFIFFIALFIILQTHNIFIPLLFPETYSEKYAEYLSSDQEGAVSLSLIMLHVVIATFLTAKMVGRKSPVCDFFIISSLVAIGLYMLGFISTPLYRLGLFANIFICLSVPYALARSEGNGLLTKSFFITLVIFFWWFSYVHNGSHETIPYEISIPLI